MLELIGVDHTNRIEADAVFSYVKAKYPSLQSVMLEYDGNRIDGNSLDDEFPYWEYLADRFSQMGVRIINGDPLFEEVCNAGAYYVFKPIRKDKLPQVRKKLTEIVITKRDPKMEEIIQKYSPQISIVGEGHAAYLKKLHPNVPHTYFCIGDIFKTPQKKMAINRKEVLSCIDQMFTLGFCLYRSESTKAEHPQLKVEQIVMP